MHLGTGMIIFKYSILNENILIEKKYVNCLNCAQLYYQYIVQFNKNEHKYPILILREQQSK